MHELQCAEQRAGDQIHLLLRGRSADPLEPALQRAAGNEVEQHIDRIVRLEDSADIDDVGMTELCEQTRLVEELAACPLVVGVGPVLGEQLQGAAVTRHEVGREEFLEGKVIVQALVEDLVGDAEAAPTEVIHDLVGIDMLSDRQRSVVIGMHERATVPVPVSNGFVDCARRSRPGSETASWR